MGHKIPGQAFVAVDALTLAGIVTHIVGQALTNHEDAQNLRAGIDDGVGEAPFAVTDEIAGTNRVVIFADGGGSGAAQDIDGFVLVVVDVVFGCLIPRRDLDEVNAETGQTGGTPRSSSPPGGSARRLRSSHRRAGAP